MEREKEAGQPKKEKAWGRIWLAVTLLMMALFVILAVLLAGGGPTGNRQKEARVESTPSYITARGTVMEYLDALARGDYSVAYALLSPRCQSELSYDAFCVAWSGLALPSPTSLTPLVTGSQTVTVEAVFSDGTKESFQLVPVEDYGYGIDSIGARQ